MRLRLPQPERRRSLQRLESPERELANYAFSDHTSKRDFTDSGGDVRARTSSTSGNGAYGESSHATGGDACTKTRGKTSGQEARGHKFQ